MYTKITWPSRVAENISESYRPFDQWSDIVTRHGKNPYPRRSQLETLQHRTRSFIAWRGRNLEDSSFAPLSLAFARHRSTSSEIVMKNACENKPMKTFLVGVLFVFKHVANRSCLCQDSALTDRFDPSPTTPAASGKHRLLSGGSIRLVSVTATSA